MSEYSGLSLGAQWDLVIDESTGDLQVDTGVDEVRKDLAFAVGRGLTDESVIGVPLDPGTIADIKLYVERIVTADPRVSSVSDIRVETDSGNGILTIAVTALLGSFSRTVVDDIDGDSIQEQVSVEVAFEDGSLVQTNVIGEV